MTIIEVLKNFFIRLFPTKKAEPNIVIEHTDIDEPISLEEIEEFKLKNVIMDKIDYLEQYIKIFSLNFPEQYNHYLGMIQAEKADYQEELKEYIKSFGGNITFSIDPENESKRLVKVVKLENEIKDFVEFVVNYKRYKEKFSKLCFKLNHFYNAVIDTKRDVTEIMSQLGNANITLLGLIEEVKSLTFFKKDTRKKEEILKYVLFCDYIMFKITLRCNATTNFDEYFDAKSVVSKLFDDKYYKNTFFKFFIDDLERLQEYIMNNLTNNVQYNYLLNCCKSLQEELVVTKTEEVKQFYFDELIKFENTMNSLVESDNISFDIEAPKSIISSNTSIRKQSVNRIAISFLDLINTTTSKILLKVISSFQFDISWREFYFLCKIFEIYDRVMEISSTTIFDSIKNNFLKLDGEYSEYTAEYIKNHKAKLLSRTNVQNKKYILFMTLGSMKEKDVICELNKLMLDYKVVEQVIYLNHSYFNGFKNLERNFGKYIIL